MLWSSAAHATTSHSRQPRWLHETVAVVESLSARRHDEAWQATPARSPGALHSQTLGPPATRPTHAHLKEATASLLRTGTKRAPRSEPGGGENGRARRANSSSAPCTAWLPAVAFAMAASASACSVSRQLVGAPPLLAGSQHTMMPDVQGAAHAAPRRKEARMGNTLAIPEPLEPCTGRLTPQSSAEAHW